MRSPTSGLTVGQALALGALHGPAELLPVSSSAHISAVPWLLGWRYGELDPELRKSFEVALHTGTTVALLLGWRTMRGEFDRRRLRVIALSAIPPAVAGYALEHEIERHLGTPQKIAAALFAGGAVMTLADRFPEARSRDEAGVRDGLLLGLAQACALVPGVSRSGATRAAARFQRFHAYDARLLADEAALPVLTGAALLKAMRLRRRGLDRRSALTFAAGAAASLVSTLAFSRAARPGVLPERLSPYAAYRGVLASAIVIRLMRDSRARRSGRALP